jgi:trans-aconitate methyltransferase
VTSEPVIALGEVIDRLERAWYPAEAWQSLELHPYTPWPISDFIPALCAAMLATSGRRYLEIGCGIGTKLVIAEAFGLETHGIDVREQYVAAARHLCPEARIEIADARGYDLRPFDVVYSYRPFIHENQQAEFDETLVGRMKRGSVLITPDRHMPEWSPIAPHVWSN